MASHRLRWTIPILAGLFLGVALLTSVGIYVTTRRAAQVPDVAVAAQPDAPPPIDATPETALTITTDPAGASVRVDDADHGTSPVSLRIPKGRNVTIVVQRDGYEPTRQIVTLDHDKQAVTLTLRPIPVAPDAGTLAGSALPPRHVGSGGPKRNPGRGSAGSGSAANPKFNPDDAVGGD